MPPPSTPADPAPPAALRRALAGLVDPGARWTPLAGGRVNRLWRVGEVVVKRYDPRAASPLFPNDPDAEAAALAAFAPAGLAPLPLGRGNGWLAYRYHPGRRWSGRMADEPPGGVARLLGRLHRQPAGGLGFLRRLPSGADALRAQGRAILRGCAGGLPPPPDVADPGPAPVPVPIHGDAVPGNVIAGPAGLVLIDWQCPALGDPAEDLALFLSPAMQMLYRGAPLTATEADAFLSAYPDPRAAGRYRALAPLFRWRMAAHCLWRAERGAPDYRRAQALEGAADAAGPSR